MPVRSTTPKHHRPPPRHGRNSAQPPDHPVRHPAAADPADAAADPVHLSSGTTTAPPATTLPDHLAQGRGAQAGREPTRRQRSTNGPARVRYRPTARSPPAPSSPVPPGRLASPSSAITLDRQGPPTPTPPNRRPHRPPRRGTVTLLRGASPRPPASDYDCAEAPSAPHPGPAQGPPPTLTHADADGLGRTSDAGPGVDARSAGKWGWLRRRVPYDEGAADARRSHPPAVTLPGGPADWFPPAASVGCRLSAAHVRVAR